MRISGWSSDVCASDRDDRRQVEGRRGRFRQGQAARGRLGVQLDPACHRRFRMPGPQPGVGEPVAQFVACLQVLRLRHRSEEHTSELQSLMRISYAVFCLKKKNLSQTITQYSPLCRTTSM